MTIEYIIKTSDATLQEDAIKVSSFMPNPSLAIVGLFSKGPVEPEKMVYLGWMLNNQDRLYHVQMKNHKAHVQCAVIKQGKAHLKKCKWVILPIEKDRVVFSSSWRLDIQVPLTSNTPLHKIINDMVQEEIKAIENSLAVDHENRVIHSESIHLNSGAIRLYSRLPRKIGHRGPHLCLKGDIYSMVSLEKADTKLLLMASQLMKEDIIQSLKNRFKLVSKTIDSYDKLDSFSITLPKRIIYTTNSQLIIGNDYVYEDPTNALFYSLEFLGIDKDHIVSLSKEKYVDVGFNSDSGKLVQEKRMNNSQITKTTQTLNMQLQEPPTTTKSKRVPKTNLYLSIIVVFVVLAFLIYRSTK